MTSLLGTLVRIHAYGKEMDYVKPFVPQERKESVGSGTFVTPPLGAVFRPDALYILTCAHVIDGADQVSVVLPLRGSEKLEARVLAFVPRDNYDLAVLELPNENGMHNPYIHVLPVGKSTALEPGEKLVALGFPMAQTGLKVSDGVFAGLEDYLQHTVSISPGNSGGPLINSSGQLIGINNAGLVHVAASNIGYAVPIELYTLTAPRFFSGITTIVRQPMFGFLLQPTTKKHLEREAGVVNKTGMYIFDVIPTSPVAAEVQAGDFLCEVENVPVDFQGEIQVSWSVQKVPLHTVLQRLSDPSKTYAFTVFRSKTKQWDTVHMSPVEVDLHASLYRYNPYEHTEYMNIEGFILMELCRNHRQYKELRHAFTELTVQERFQSHVIITHVVPGSPADVSKTLKDGDRIVQVNNVPVRTLVEVQRALSNDNNLLTTSKGKSTVI
jgi:S1-C subfamily serine protease